MNLKLSSPRRGVIYLTKENEEILGLSPEALEAFERTFSDWACELQNAEALSEGSFGDLKALAERCAVWALCLGSS